MILDSVLAGTTSYSCTIRIVDATDGTPETGVVWNTAGIDLWYRRPATAHTSITEATQTEGGAYSSGGFVHISDGYYRLDLPDAAVAASAEYVDVGGTVTGMIVIGGRIRLNLEANAVQVGGTTQTATDIGGNTDAMNAGIILGTCGSSSLTITTCSSDLVGYTADQLVGRLITFYGAGPASGEQAGINDYVVTNGVLTFDDLTLAPENTNPFKIT